MTKIFSISIIISAIILFTSCNTIKNARTEQVHIYGNCGMCKETIEESGNKKNEAKVNWNKDTKMADLTYDTTKTNQNEILKRIAKAGYDSDNFLAPDDAYTARPECCHYERNPKAMHKIAPPIAIKTDSTEEVIRPVPPKPVDTAHAIITTSSTSPFKAIFDDYISLKNVLIKSDGKQAGALANSLLKSFQSIDMNGLNSNVHSIFMKQSAIIKSSATAIANSKDIAKQRNSFMQLSEAMIALMKTDKNEGAIYVQHCPMYNDGKGANWLSKEKEIKNPYYGSQMLNCGSVQETIK